jgi:hypothetical protein
MVVGALNLQAQSGVCTNAATGGLWSNGANWLKGTVATGSDNTANFSKVDLTTDPTVINLDSARAIGNLIFGGINLNTAAGRMLELGPHPPTWAHPQRFKYSTVSPLQNNKAVEESHRRHSSLPIIATVKLLSSSSSWRSPD